MDYTYNEEELNQLQKASNLAHILGDYLDQIVKRANTDGLVNDTKEKVLAVIEYDLGHFNEMVESFKTA